MLYVVGYVFIALVMMFLVVRMEIIQSPGTAFLGGVIWPIMLVMILAGTISVTMLRLYVKFLERPIIIAAFDWARNACKECGRSNKKHSDWCTKNVGGGKDGA